MFRVKFQMPSTPKDRIQRFGFPVESALPQFHQRLVDDDPHHPGAKAGAAMKLAKLAISFPFGVLDDVFRVFLIVGHFQGTAIEAVMVMSDERGERLGAARPRLG
jgi:hypothetical protein